MRGTELTVDEVERNLSNVSDPGFRGRVIHEYETVRRMVGNRVRLGESRILDFGCGQGIAAAAFALRLPDATVFGTDIFGPRMSQLQADYARLTGLDVPSNLTILHAPPGTLSDEVVDLDLVYAWSVFEHIEFSQLVDTMGLVRSRLALGGVFALQINPLFYSPRGAHLYRYVSEPWSHLLYQTDVLRRLVMGSPLPETSKIREWEQYETLNRATADDIVHAARVAGFEIAREERLETALSPPERLLGAYKVEALATEEIRLVLV